MSDDMRCLLSVVSFVLALVSLVLSVGASRKEQK
jgi:hypothetical protein